MVERIREGDIPGVQLRCRVPLALPAAAAWSKVCDPESQQRWLADEVSGSISDELRLVGLGEGGLSRVEICRTLECTEARWVSAFRREHPDWTVETRLTLELFETAPQSCELSILQQGFQRLSLSVCLTCWEEYRRRWRLALERLQRV